MNFSSLEFIFFFFPITVGVNFLLPQKARNYWLLLASLFFYAWGEPTFFLLLLLSVVVNYSLGLLLSFLNGNPAVDPGFAREPSVKKHFCLKKVLFILTILLNLALLFVTKYLNVFTAALRNWIPSLQGAVPQTTFVLPLAVSFYTFQSLSYIIDVYRGMKAEKNLFSYALYITFFPQLLQGPILRYADFRPQLENRKAALEGFADGVIRFLTGFNQKILLANILAEAADAAFEAGPSSVAMAWLGMLAYSLQLYFDFAGYSDMAVGLGKMFGFRFAENFNFPYISKSVSEFWRRWHITLGAWFRDYLYFPLGGSRGSSRVRIAMNLMIVWLATGIWHGADGTFILWGLMHGVFIVMEKLTGLPEKLKNRKVLQFFYHFVVLFEAMFGWMFFRSADMPAAWNYAQTLFRLNGSHWRDSVFKFNSREYIVTFLFALTAAFPLVKTLRDRISARGGKYARSVRLVWYLLQIILAVISVSSLVISSHDPFVYVNF